MDSRERNLANRQTFLVTVTRLRDGLTLIADNAEKLGRAIKSNSGEKASALEVTQRLKRSEEHTSELQSLMRISYAVFCLKKKIQQPEKINLHQHYKTIRVIIHITQQITNIT